MVLNMNYEVALFSDEFFNTFPYHDREGWDKPERLLAAINGFRRAVPNAINIKPQTNGLLAASLVHSSDYVSFIEEGSKLERSNIYGPTYIVGKEDAIFSKPISHKGLHTLYFFDAYTMADYGSCNGALLGASCAFDAAMWVKSADIYSVRSAYIACRPPGHHAFRNFGGGLCLFNNAAIAATVLKKDKRVAIIDIDVDHGNGTQSIFYESPDVFTFSIHAEGWPYVSGYVEEIGKNEGRNTNMNIPLPSGTTGEIYLEKLDIVIEKVKDFNPGYLVVALGFDAHKDDSYDGKFGLNASDFARISNKIKKLGLPTVFTQEGGYNTLSTFSSSRAFFSEWMRNEP